MQLAGSADWGVHAWLKNYYVTSVFLKQVCDVEAGNVSLDPGLKVSAQQRQFRDSLNA